jgi:caa(3)-type oxidase subunit IV
MSEEHAEHHGPSYFKTYVMLMILMFLSIAGYEAGNLAGIQAIALFSAFGIAVVKAYLVASRFMHLNIEKRYVVYMLTTCLAFMFLFYTAISPDIQRDTGTNWIKPAWIERERAWDAGEWVDPHPAAGHGHGEEAGHGEAAAHH